MPPSGRSFSSTHALASPWGTYLSEAKVQWGEAGTDHRSTGKVVFVLGNAYGLMNYQQPLATAIAHAGFPAVWTTGPGQEGAPGSLGLEQGVSFLRGLATLPQLSTWSVAFICHCASTIAVLQLLGRFPLENVRSLVLYGPLVNLAQLRDDALPRLNASGVRFSLPTSTWDISVQALFATVTTPTMIAHSRDFTNIRRASEDQIYRLSTRPNVRRVFVADHGYDDTPNNLAMFAQEYVAFLRDHLPDGL